MKSDELPIHEYPKFYNAYIEVLENVEMIEELEEWRDVPSQPRILASNLGRVKLKPWVKAMPKGEILSREGKPTFGIKFKANKQAKHVYYGWRIREKAGQGL